MTNNVDNRVLGRKGARTLSNEEVLMVTGGSITPTLTHVFPYGVILDWS